MAIHNFYHNKLIDDANLSCWKIIMAWCDDGNTHFYVDPCEVLEQCLATYPPIDRCSMIPWIVEWQPWIVNAWPWRVLRINNAWTCVERADPSNVFNDTDELVKVSSTDTTAGTLIQKIVSCDDDLLTISIINQWWYERLQLCPNFPTLITELTDVEDTYPNCPNREWNLRFFNNSVFFECDRLFASYFCSQNIEFTNIPQNVIQFRPLHNQPWWPWWTHVPHFDIFYWDTNFLGSSQNGAFRIPWNGMYRIYLKANCELNYNIQAFRLAIATTNSKWLIADSKFGADPLTSIVANLDQWAFHCYKEMNCECIVYLEAWTYVAPIVRRDTNVSNTMLNKYSHLPPSWSRFGRVKIFRSSLWSWTYESGAEFPHSWSGAQFTIQWLSKFRWDSPYIYT